MNSTGMPSDSTLLTWRKRDNSKSTARWPGLPDFELQAGLGIEPGGRRHFRLDLVLRHADRFGLGLFSHHSGGIARPAARFAHRESAPHVVISFSFDCLLLARPDLLRGKRIEVEVKVPELASLEARMQHAIVVCPVIRMAELAVSGWPDVGSELLKLSSSRKASNWARLWAR